jgi:hypothetical protein
MNFVTTNIRLGAEVYQRLRLKAVQERKSLAQLIRNAVDVVYGERPSSRHSRTRRKRPFDGLVGICDSGIRDGAVHHDRDIYGIAP